MIAEARRGASRIQPYLQRQVLYSMLGNSERSAQLNT